MPSAPVLWFGVKSFSWYIFFVFEDVFVCLGVYVRERPQNLFQILHLSIPSTYLIRGKFVGRLGDIYSQSIDSIIDYNSSYIGYIYIMTHIVFGSSLMSNKTLPLTLFIYECIREHLISWGLLILRTYIPGRFKRNNPLWLLCTHFSGLRGRCTLGLPNFGIHH